MKSTSLPRSATFALATATLALASTVMLSTLALAQTTPQPSSPSAPAPSAPAPTTTAPSNVPAPSAASPAPAVPAPSATAPSASTVVAKVAVPGGVFYRGTAPGQYMAKDRLIGTNVTGKDGKIIGDIEDLILNSANEVEGVIIGVGGFLGAGEKKVGVRFSALDIKRKDGKTTIAVPTATKDILASVEPYKRAEPAKSLLERAKDKAQALSEKAKDGAGPAYDKAKEAGKSVVEKGKQLIEQGKDKMTAPKQ
jgi:sporulation protein YlmC with PRC-barrel domain